LPAPIIPIVIGFGLLFNKLKRFILYLLKLNKYHN
jgi:hypothetical protein